MAQHYDDDIIDTSPISEDFPADGNHRRPSLPIHESIEIYPSSASESADDEAWDDVQAERPSKRRRVSISPTENETSLHDEERTEKAISEDDRDPMEITYADPSSQPALSPTTRYHGSDAPPPLPIAATSRHPTFLEAPRFKPIEPPDESRNRQPPLPEAFSPQRRGAKYVPGGLAAELRDWLVQVKGASEYDRPAGANLQVTIKEVSHETGNGMRLVATSAGMLENVQQQESGEDGTQIGPARVILAGEGRITGLDRPNMVREGGQVVLFQPMWDVELGDDLGRFAVACDWEAVTE